MNYSFRPPMKWPLLAYQASFPTSLPPDFLSAISDSHTCSSLSFHMWSCVWNASSQPPPRIPTSFYKAFYLKCFWEAFSIFPWPTWVPFALMSVDIMNLCIEAVGYYTDLCICFLLHYILPKGRNWNFCVFAISNASTYPYWSASSISPSVHFIFFRNTSGGFRIWLVTET